LRNSKQDRALQIARRLKKCDVAFIRRFGTEERVKYYQTTRCCRQTRYCKPLKNVIKNWNWAW